MLALCSCNFGSQLKASRGCDGGSVVTGMIVTARVADSGLGGTFLGEAPFSAPQAEENLAQNARFQAFFAWAAPHQS